MYMLSAEKITSNAVYMYQSRYIQCYNIGLYNNNIVVYTWHMAVDYIH